jgi:hypothetical protein
MDVSHVDLNGAGLRHFSEVYVKNVNLKEQEIFTENRLKFELPCITHEAILDPANRCDHEAGARDK